MWWRPARDRPFPAPPPGPAAPPAPRATAAAPAAPPQPPPPPAPAAPRPPCVVAAAACPRRPTPPAAGCPATVGDRAPSCRCRRAGERGVVDVRTGAGDVERTSLHVPAASADARRSTRTTGCRRGAGATGRSVTRRARGPAPVAG